MSAAAIASQRGSTTSRRSIRIGRLAAAAVLLVAACETPQVTPSPSDLQPAATVVSVPDPSAAPAATFGPAPTDAPPPPEPAALDLILADLEAGRLDEPTATLYRLYASVADDRLPEAYRGEWLEDNEAIDQARERFDTYSPELQAEVLPFIVRPTSPLSYWAAADGPSPAVARAGMRGSTATSLGLAAPAPVAAVTCVDGFFRQQADAPAKAVVWGQCGGASQAAVEARVNEIALYMGQLWEPMTRDMGQPIGDREDPGDPNDNFAETNDGLLDIYVVNANLNRRGRYLNSTGYAANSAAYPFGGAPASYTASSYMVFEQGRFQGGDVLKSVLAHEFFHSLSKAHNHGGMETSFGRFWFVEASAMWSEHQFVPAARRERGDPFFHEFRASNQSLSSVNPKRNAYGSWMWPLFMAQEATPTSVADAWNALEGQHGFINLMTSVDRQLSFETNFREFAVRVWNQELLGGDPIEPDFQDWDGQFPRGAPGPARLLRVLDVLATEPTAPPIEVQTVLPSLWAGYVFLNVKPEVKQLIVDFSQLAPADALDVDALVKIENGDWERRELPDGRTRFCLDDPDDAVAQAIIVLSNHDMQPSTTVRQKWTVQGLAQGCADVSGTITITREGIYNSVDGPATMRSEHLTATLAVDMISDPDPFGGGGYIDAGSTYTIQRTTLESRQMGDCVSTYGTKSDGTWKFTDHPAGAEWENNITGFIEPSLELALFAVVAHYPYSVTEDACNLYPSPNLGVHDAFGCKPPGGFGGGLEGRYIEVEDGPDRIEFSCTEVLEGGGWTTLTTTVTGSLTVKDRAP